MRKNRTVAQRFRLSQLEFSHVSFHYPNTEAMVLKDMCFRIEKGHHYAFVRAQRLRQIDDCKADFTLV